MPGKIIDIRLSSLSHLRDLLKYASLKNTLPVEVKATGGGVLRIIVVDNVSLLRQIRVLARAGELVCRAENLDTPWAGRATRRRLAWVPVGPVKPRA